jgi:hypothetical protein
MLSDNQEKYKGTALKTIMNNPKLSKIIKDGLSSPIGSTKRVQARSILSVIKKISGDTNTNKFLVSHTLIHTHTHKTPTPPHQVSVWDQQGLK